MRNETSGRIVSDNIFDDFTRDTVIVIPVDGSFEYRLESNDFPQGIKPQSLHGQLIQRLGSDTFRLRIDQLIKQKMITLKGIKLFPGACRDGNAEIGECITIYDNRGIRYCLIVVSYLNNRGEARLSDSDAYQREMEEFHKIIDKLIKHINKEYSKADVRIPMIGTGVLRSGTKNFKASALRLIQERKYKEKLKNCTWNIYEK